jgi:predicted small lipoprotein YifL
MIRKVVTLALGIFGLVTLTGCGVLGPASVVRDRFNYNSAIGESWKNQMLQNVVKIRYADMPVFLDVSSVVSQYELKGGLIWRDDSFLAPFVARGSYTEKPTISYTPLSGEKFIKSLMTPLPPEIMLHMIEAGWPADFIFRICVQAINGMYNQSGFQMNSHPADSEFNELLVLLASIQKSGVLTFGIEHHTHSEEIILMFREHPDPKMKSEIASVMRLLRLDPGTRRFTVTAGICPEDNNEVTIQTRSILMILESLAMGVEVPGVHIDNAHSPAEPDVNNAEIKSLVGIFSGNNRPKDAYAAIRYRGHWFWIDNNDMESKRAFSFIQLIMNLSEAGEGGKGPVLTLPTG